MTRLSHNAIRHAGLSGAAARVLSTPGTLDFLTFAR